MNINKFIKASQKQSIEAIRYAYKGVFAHKKD